MMWFVDCSYSMNYSVLASHMTCTVCVIEPEYEWHEPFLTCLPLQSLSSWWTSTRNIMSQQKGHHCVGMYIHIVIYTNSNTMATPAAEYGMSRTHGRLWYLSLQSSLSRWGFVSSFGFFSKTHESSSTWSLSSRFLPSIRMHNFADLCYIGQAL